MKLSARDANSWIAKPPEASPATLIYGEDGMRVALKRQDLVRNIAGPKADDEMRLSRISGADLRKDKSLLADALKAQGFFPGPRVALLEDANQHNADQIIAALKDWRPGDAHLVVTCGSLKPSSPIRKTFEKHPTAGCIAVYDNPPDRGEIDGWIGEAGLNPDRDGTAAIHAMAQDLAPGDLRQVMGKLALYKHGDDSPLTADEVAACAPASTEADRPMICDKPEQTERRHIRVRYPMRGRVSRGYQPDFPASTPGEVEPEGRARMTMSRGRTSTANQTFFCVGAFMTATFVVVAIDGATLPEGVTLTREGGSIETMSMLGYIACIAAYMWKSPLPPFWPMPMSLLFLSAREFDADKKFTSEGILSTKILFYDTPLWEELLALGVWAVLAVTVVALIRYRGLVLMRALRRGSVWGLAVTVGILLAGFSKTIDGLARKLAPWGIDVSQSVNEGAGMLEEYVEILIPVFFLIAIFLRARSAGAEHRPA